jgi:biotin synthase
VFRDLAGEIVVLVLQTNGTHGHLLCDGVRMVAGRSLPCSDPRNSSVTGSTLLSGRRYADRLRRIEVRCLRGGHARLTFAGLPLTTVHTAVEQCPQNRAKLSWTRRISESVSLIPKKAHAVSEYLIDLADRQLAGGRLSRDEAYTILSIADQDVLALVAAAARLRRAHFGNWVKVNYLVNLKSGRCPEDCIYCSQRLGSDPGILRYSWLPQSEAIRQAKAGIAAGASRVCLVASGRGPSERDVDRVGEMAGQLKAEHPGVEICACLGILRDGQADRLQAAGVNAYNHNINTSESRYSDICTTHDYSDRVATIDKVKAAGLSPCAGLIVGMGESDDDVINAIFALHDLGSDSIPVNFLMPFDGTPLADTWLLTPMRCLRILALARFACPATEIRLAGGREMHLRSLQPLGIHVANSLFLGDYLTSEGQAAKADLQMIADAGFRVVANGGSDGRDLASDNHTATTLRRRGAGTSLAPNA